MAFENYGEMRIEDANAMNIPVVCPISTPTQKGLNISAWAKFGR